MDWLLARQSSIETQLAGTDARGCPVAVEVFADNTADPSTVKDQIEKLRTRLGLERAILVGDRSAVARRSATSLDHGTSRSSDRIAIGE